MMERFRHEAGCGGDYYILKKSTESIGSDLPDKKDMLPHEYRATRVIYCMDYTVI